MTASGLPTRGDNPNFVPIQARVGPQTCPRPSSSVNILATVPLPVAGRPDQQEAASACRCARTGRSR